MAPSVLYPTVDRTVEVAFGYVVKYTCDGGAFDGNTCSSFSCGWTVFVTILPLAHTGWKTSADEASVKQKKLALKFEHVSHSTCNLPPPPVAPVIPQRATLTGTSTYAQKSRGGHPSCDPAPLTTSSGTVGQWERRHRATAGSKHLHSPPYATARRAARTTFHALPPGTYGSARALGATFSKYAVVTPLSS